MKKLCAVLAILLSGCATHMTMTGKPYEPVDALQVKVLFREKPACKYEELGFITTPLSWNQEVAVGKAREKAAEVGADYIVIESVLLNASNDCTVSATAYKCSPVNRERVELHP